jgi:hypothetical protein
MKLNFKEQINKTVDFIVKNNITSLDLKQTSYREYSCWGEICKALLKQFDSLISLRLWKNWKFNVKGYRDAVYDCLKKRGINNFQQIGIY